MCGAAVKCKLRAIEFEIFRQNTGSIKFKISCISGKDTVKQKKRVVINFSIKGKAFSDSLCSTIENLRDTLHCRREIP